MSALGEVYAMHAYIGTQSLCLFRKMEAEEITDAGEFFASQHSVYVEFVPKAELERQDRQLLTGLDYPQGRGLASPIFRTIRPGFHPWFVTEEEAMTPAECIRAVIVVAACSSDTFGNSVTKKASSTIIGAKLHCIVHGGEVQDCAREDI